MRLRTLLMDESKTALDALESCNIKTDEDLLLSSNSLLALFQRLPPGCITFSDLERIRGKVLNNVAAKGISGYEILKQSESGSPRSSAGPLDWACGHDEIDCLLNSVKAGVIEIAGRDGSANSSLVLNIALACLSGTPDIVVHWIDTVGEFSAERASNILKGSTAKPVSCALERLHVSLAFTVEAAYNVLAMIRSESTASADAKRSCRVRLIIIDSITPLFVPHMTTGSSEGQALMTAFMRDLQDLAISQGLIALVTNNATTAQHPKHDPTSSRLMPALGAPLTFLTDTTLWLSHAQEMRACSGDLTLPLLKHDGTEDMDSVYIAEVLRSRSAVDRVWWPFSLSDGALGKFPSSVNS
ncbi:hypothetical protein M0805_005282 [Coniferiporia weirii]|nr:hypothetical protein M0805_005282 [Coniferiporia weirii]